MNRGNDKAHWHAQRVKQAQERSSESRELLRAVKMREETKTRQKESQQQEKETKRRQKEDQLKSYKETKTNTKKRERQTSVSDRGRTRYANQDRPEIDKQFQIFF